MLETTASNSFLRWKFGRYKLVWPWNLVVFTSQPARRHSFVRNETCHCITCFAAMTVQKFKTSCKNPFACSVTVCEKAGVSILWVNAPHITFLASLQRPFHFYKIVWWKHLLNRVLFTNLLNKAGDVAARLFKPSSDGFIVKTTWRLFITWKYNSINIKICLL